MRAEFQEELLRWLCQTKEAKKYIEVLEPEAFDLINNQIVFGLLQGFVKKYNGLPSLANLLQFYDTELQKKSEKFDADTIKLIEDTIKSAYAPVKTNTQQIREAVLTEYQKKLTQSLFLDYSSKIKDATPETINELYTKFRKIKSVGDTDLEEVDNKGTFLLADHKPSDYELVQGIPTYLKGLNRMTSVGGFFSPQLIIFMGAPKSFKTGTLLNVAKGYVQDGYNVYYADCENGERRITDRMKQSMLGATYSELVSGEEEDILKNMVNKYKLRGGDFLADFYPAHTKNINDIDERLQELRDTVGWTPKVICFDYLDLFQPIDYRIKEKRLQIQAVYFDAIRLLKKWGCIGISLSQVSRDAVNKLIIKASDFAEDFGKAANAHAAFALCGTEEEREAGFLRITPVVQRDGVAQHSGAAAYMKVDEGRMTLEETTYDEWYDKIGHKYANSDVDDTGKIKSKGDRRKMRASERRKIEDKDLQDE